MVKAQIIKCIPLLVLAGTAACAALAIAQAPGAHAIRKATLADTIKANIYADNWFQLYINGELVAVDSIRFLPHNVISVDILPAYPMTIAVMARDNADTQTGMEYANTNIGDGGFILKLGDGTVTSASWKCLVISHGPVGGDTLHPEVENLPEPAQWYVSDFDDRAWLPATEYSQEAVGPKQPFYDYDFGGARFIWGPDLKLDNTVLFRFTAMTPPDGRERHDFRGLNDMPMNGPRGSGPRR